VQDRAAASSQLEAAKQILDSIPTPTDGDAMRRISDLRRDFDALRAAYALAATSSAPQPGAQPARPVPAVPPPPRPTDTGAATRPAPVGTVGAAEASPPTAAEADWRMRYAVVDGDLLVLLGPATNSATTGAVAVNPEIRSRLQEFRSRMQQFRQQAGGQTPGTTPTAGNATPPAGGQTTSETRVVDSASARTLLDRIQQTINKALAEGGKGDTTKSAGKVLINRADLDEILAEVAQLRVMVTK
jgi:hypothetical protein